jgi:hypothetical protein
MKKLKGCFRKGLSCLAGCVLIGSLAMPESANALPLNSFLQMCERGVKKINQPDSADFIGCVFYIGGVMDMNRVMTPEGEEPKAGCREYPVDYIIKYVIAWLRIEYKEEIDGVIATYAVASALESMCKSSGQMPR